MKKIIILVVAFLLLFGSVNYGYAQSFEEIFEGLFGVGAQQGASANELVDLLQSLGGFLIISGGVIAGIVLIWSGIVYMGAGSNPTKVATAKAIFKNGLIGALILFAAGVIMATIVAFATDPQSFFS